MVRKTRKIKDKWKEKKWITVSAPDSFNNIPVAYIPITDDKNAVGRVIEVTLFDILKAKNLIDQVGFKDLGAGGVACASVELAETSGYGSEIWMNKIHKGMEGLHSSVYLCSETQERFMWVCPPSLTKLIINHYNTTFDLSGVSNGAMASVIGKIRDNGQYIVHDKDEEIVNAAASEVTKGFLYDRPYEDPKKSFKEPFLETPSDFNKILLISTPTGKISAASFIMLSLICDLILSSSMLKLLTTISIFLDELFLPNL